MILALQIVSNTAQFWQLSSDEKLTFALTLNEKQDWWLKVVIHMKRLSTKVGNFSFGIFQTEINERVSGNYQEANLATIHIQRFTKNSLEYHNPQTCIPVHLDHLDNHVFHHSGDCCQCTSGPHSSTRWCWGWCWTRCCCTRTGRERTPSYLIHELQQGCNIASIEGI